MGDAWKSGLNAAGESLGAFATGAAGGYAAVGASGAAVQGTTSFSTAFGYMGNSLTASLTLGSYVTGNAVSLVGNVTNNQALNVIGGAISQFGSIMGAGYTMLAGGSANVFNLMSNSMGLSTATGVLGELVNNQYYLMEYL